MKKGSDMKKFDGFDSHIQKTLKEACLPSDYGLDCFVTSEVAYNEVLSKCMPAESAAGGAYLGVGPCQNYIYIGAFKPVFGVILDARVDNLLEHLVFKLIFERSASPRQYLANLFSRDAEPEDGDSSDCSGRELASWLESRPVSSAKLETTLSVVKQELASRWKLEAALIKRVERIVTEFFRRQLRITSVSEECLVNLDKIPDFGEVLCASSSQGFNLHFLSSHERFRWVKDLHAADRIVPILGNLISAENVKTVNELLETTGTRLRNVYLSNMEEFLLKRYVISNNRITSRPNPNGMIVDAHLQSYEKLVETLAALRCDHDCALIRFYFPGEYRGRRFGIFPWLEGNVGFLSDFLNRHKAQRPECVFQTYV